MCIMLPSTCLRIQHTDSQKKAQFKDALTKYLIHIPLTQLISNALEDS